MGVRFEIYVPERESEVINKLNEKGRSEYIRGLIKKDLKQQDAGVTEERIIEMIKKYGAKQGDNEDIKDSIKAIFEF